MSKVITVSESDIRRVVYEAVRHELSKRHKVGIFEGRGYSGSISIGDFKRIVGWNMGNMPLNEGSLKLSDGTSVAMNRGMRINGREGFSSCYRYDIMKGVVFFPIVFALGGRRCTVSNKAEIDDFVRDMALDEPFEIKKEIMNSSGYSEIRADEIAHSDRLPFEELYDWHTERFYGYKFIEI